MAAAPTIAHTLSEVSVTGVAGASAAGSGWLPKSELLPCWPLPFEFPLPFELPPVAGAWASLLVELLELSPPPELSVELPELSVEPPELSVEPVLPPELSVEPVLPPEVSVEPVLPELSVLPPEVSGPGWKSEFELGAFWPGQVCTLASQ